MKVTGRMPPVDSRGVVIRAKMVSEISDAHVAQAERIACAEVLGRERGLRIIDESTKVVTPKPSPYKTYTFKEDGSWDMKADMKGKK